MDKKKPILDVVITTAGRFDCLETCLNAVYREAQDNPIGVYIIDDFSNPEERIANQPLFEYQPDKDPAHNIMEWKTKRFQQSQGFPIAANEGAREGKAPLIMFLSDDVELHEGTLDKVIRRLDDPTIGVVGIKLLFPPTSTSPNRPAGKVQHIGLTLNIRGEPIHPLVGWSADNPKCCISRDMWAVTGACYTIRRQLYYKAGGFDKSYGKGTFEDVDLCMAIRQLGHRVFIDCSAVGYHWVGATVEKQKQPYNLAGNRMTFLSKWQNSGLMAWNEHSLW